MEDNLGGGGLDGGWNPAQYHHQWPEQFGTGELGFPSQTPAQYQGFDGLYSQQQDSLPEQGWAQQQGDYYTGHQTPVGGYGYSHDQAPAAYSAPQAQPAQGTWQSFQPPSQSGYAPAPAQYSNPLAANPTGSPSPYAQQARFIPNEPIQPQSQVAATPVSQQPNEYGMNAGQAVPQPQRPPLQQHSLHQPANQQATQQQSLHQQSLHQRPVQHQPLQHQPLQQQQAQQQQAQQQQAQQQSFQPQPLQKQPAQHQQAQLQAIQQQPTQRQPVQVQQQAIQQQPAQQHQPMQAQQILQPQARYIPSPAQSPPVVDASLKEVKLPRMRNASGSVPAAVPPVSHVPSPVTRPSSVPVANPSTQPAAAPKHVPASRPATTPVPPPTTGGSQGLAAPNSAEADVPTIHIDSEMRKEAEARKLVWPGVPNLVVKDNDVQLPRPAMRYTTVVLKGDKSLFKKLPSGPMLGEVLGRHLETYLKTPLGPEYDDTRRQIDAIMDVELRRIGKTNERPKDWYSRAIPGEGRKREIPGWDNYSAKNNDNKPDYQRSDAPPTDEMATAAELFLPLPHGNNPHYVKKVVEEYALRIREAITVLKENPAYKELGNLVKQRKKDPASVSDSDITKLKESLHEQKDKLQKVITFGLEVSDVNVLQELGSRHLVTASVLNVLSNLVNQDELDSALAKAILRLLCRFTTLTPSELKVRYKFDDARRDLIHERGDDEVKTLVDSFVAMVRKNKDRDGEVKKLAKIPDSKSAKTGSPSKKSEGNASRSASGTKRVREEDNEARTSKKVATGVKASPSPVPTSALPKPATAAPAKTSSSLAAKLAAKKAPAASATATAKPATGALPGKRAPTKPAPKIEPSLSEAAKSAIKPEVTPKVDFSKLEITKPGSAKLASSSSSSATSTVNPKPVVPKKAPAPLPPSKSKFASLLDEINQPKPEKRREPTPPTDPSKPETEEEKARRLRKQERRRLGLRVTFKSDDRLVEVREFYREEGEEVGNFMTQGIDVKSENKTDEGRALKESHLSDIRTYDDLIPIDFSHMPSTSERGESYTTCGGPKEFRTAEQDFMEDRDKKVLSVVYTSKEDIPPTPKSPVLGPSSPTQTVDIWPLPDGTPPMDEASRRVKDAKQHGLLKAAQHARTRQDNPVFGQYQNVMENVDAVIRQNMAPPPPSQLAQTPAPDGTSSGMPASGATADPHRRPVDKNNLLAFRNQFKSVDWDAPGMGDARINATAEMMANIPWQEFPDVPYDPLKAKTRRRHDYSDPAVQHAADIVEDLFAKFIKENPLPSVTATANAQPQQNTFLNRMTAVPAQSIPATTSATQDDHTQAWIKYLQDNPQAAGAMYQQQFAQYQAAQNLQQAIQHGNDPTAYQQSTAAYYGQAQSSEPSYSDVQAVLAQLQQTNQQQTGAADSQAMQRGASTEGYGSYGNYSEQGNNLATSGGHDVGYDPYQAGAGHQDPDNLEGYGGSGSHGNGQAQGAGRGQGGKHSRKHQRDDHAGPRQGHNHNHGNKRNRTSGGAGGHEENDESEPARNVNPNKIGTKQCSFWLKGKCAKGDRCTYRHT